VKAARSCARCLSLIPNSATIEGTMKGSAKRTSRLTRCWPPMSEYMLNRARRARDEVATITIAPVRWRAAAAVRRDAAARR
jgi:hypothetical protein